VAAAAVAELLGLSLSDFEARRAELRDRNFPEPALRRTNIALKRWISGVCDAIRTYSRAKVWSVPIR
jgi:hypothetical protein